MYSRFLSKGFHSSTHLQILFPLPSTPFPYFPLKNSLILQASAQFCLREVSLPTSGGGRCFGHLICMPYSSTDDYVFDFSPSVPGSLVRQQVPGSDSSPYRKPWQLVWSWGPPASTH